MTTGGGNVTRTIEVFRPGTFTPMSGQAVTFSAADLQALSEAYDPVAAPAPAVVGHPKTDDPAFGWATSFRYDADAGKLLADLGELEPAFADAVAAGRYKRISLSLFQPDAPNNPKPGQFYPKHIGFLGAAAPAVSGLRPVAFAADEDGALTFEFADAGALRDVAGLFRSVRDFIIEKFGIEAADKALPGWTINWIDDAADRDPPQAAGLGFAAPSPAAPETGMTPTPAAPTAAELAERERRLAERERAADHADNLAFAERLIEEGRLLPVLKDKVVGVLDTLAAPEAPHTVSFAEDGQTKTVALLGLLKDILAAQPANISFGAVDLGGDTPTVDFALPDGMTADPGSAALHAKAVAYQGTHPGTEYMAAVAAVSR